MVFRFHINKVFLMTSHAKRVFKEEMDLAKARYTARQWAETIHHLERAHIVGQRYFWGHLFTHLWIPPRQNSCRLHRSTQGAAMKDGRGSIRTDIQRQGGGTVAAT